MIHIRAIARIVVESSLSYQLVSVKLWFWREICGRNTIQKLLKFEQELSQVEVAQEMLNEVHCGPGLLKQVIKIEETFNR